MTLSPTPPQSGSIARWTRTAVLAGLIGACASASAATGPLLGLDVLAAIPRIELAPAHVEAAINEAPVLRAPRFAADVPVNADMLSQGIRRVTADRQTLRLAIHSRDALSLSAHLTNIDLPADSQLRILDGDGLLWHGPYGAAEVGGDGALQTPLVPGDTLLLELTTPADTAASLMIASVQHGFRAVNSHGASGSCNNDVACAKADPWNDAVRASAMIHIGGQYSCSAVLLNNTREDGDPLLLTANHCGIERNGDNVTDDSNVVAYWNHYSAGCNDNADGRMDQSITGSTLLATNPDSDFTLVRLSQRPPAAYNVYYAGWDATPTEPRDGASVHYPRADEAKISFYDSAYAQTGNVDGQRVASWVVRWNDGITEPGSSGAGLWNADHRIVGQLSGGNSTCDEPDGLDLFGRMDVSWNGGSSNEERLQPWLDPDGISSRVFDGHDPQAGNARANDDILITQAAPSQALLLDPLANDIGAPPLTLVSAQASSGQADILDDRIRYAWADGESAAEIRYLVRDRNGDVHEATLRVQRLPFGIRGGALSLLMLLALVAGWRLRRR